MEDIIFHDIEWTDEKVARFWNYYYDNAHKTNAPIFAKEVGDDILKMTQKVLGSLNGKVVLDFGCGSAHLADHMQKLNIKPQKYIGIDFSQRAIDALKSKQFANFSTEGIFAQVLPSPIESASVDICFLLEVIEHMNDEYLEADLKEIYRVLKPCGKLIVTTPNEENLELSKKFCPECGCIYHRMQHVRSWNAQTLINTLKQYNFKNIKTIKTNFVNMPSKFKNLCIKLSLLISGKKANLFGIYEKVA